MLDATLTLEDQCRQIRHLTDQKRREQERLRRVPPDVLLWDGEWNLQHVISGVEYQASFQWISNDTGPGQIDIPFDHPAAQWVYDSQGRIDRGEGRNVHITVDYTEGTRWSGRMDKATVETGEDGDNVLSLMFSHDYENLKFYSVWSNPWLGPGLQFPRAFLLAGPVTWVLLTTLHLNLQREHNPLITTPDDPLDITQWDDAFDQSNWQVVVKPISFQEAADSGVTWGVASSRWATWHDMAKIMLEDAELSVTCTRYLPALGDPKPWDGANLRPGTLVIDIVDKSGVYIGTSNGGDSLDGLRRTAAEFAEDFIDSTANLLTDTEAPEEYFIPGNYLTTAEWPYVVYRTGEGSGIESSRFINSPSKAVQVNAGGHSMPGVVWPPRGNPRGPCHTGKTQRMKLSAPRSRASGISSATWSSSVAWGGLLTPCFAPSGKTRSRLGCRSRVHKGRRTLDGPATTNISKTAQTRHTPWPR